MWAVTRLLSVRLLSVLLQRVRLQRVRLLSVLLQRVRLQRVRLLSLLLQRVRLRRVRLLSLLLQRVRLLRVRLLSVLLQRVRLLSLPKKHQHVGTGAGAVRSCVALNSLIVNILNIGSGAENMTGLYSLSVDSQNVVCHGIFHYLCP